MGIYIPNKEMPIDDCWSCPVHYNLVCPLLRKIIPFGGMLDDCPLIEIPTPHGRLIIKIGDDEYEIDG